MRNEERLILACARSRMDPLHEAEIRELASGSIDWEQVVRKAEAHGLAALVCQSLGVVCPEAAPKECMERLRSRFVACLRRGVGQSRELAALMRMFEAEGVEAIAYKGPTLAQAAYGDVALRESSDLDILVRPRDVAKAGEALRKNGYQPAVNLDRLPLRLALWATQELPFSRANGATVDLHWCMTPPTLPVLLDFEAMRSPGANDLLLGLLFPALRHQWTSLKWLCDVSEVIGGGEVRWDEVTKRAAARGYTRVLRLSVLLAGELFGAPVPQWLLEEAAEDRCVRRAAEEITRRVWEGGTAGEDVWALRCAQARLLERRRDRARYWTRLFLLPAYTEWQAVRLPRWLFWLYFPLRPVRLAVKYAGKTLSKPLTCALP